MLSKKINKYIICLALIISVPLVVAQTQVDETLNSRSIKSDSSLVAKHAPISSSIRGLAIDGYDPVAYFTQNEAVKGNEEHVCDYNGATWRFSSKEHLDLFLSDPEKYAPQFGGYCALSITHNKLVVSDPESFIVKDDKLYLYINDPARKVDVDRKEITFKGLNEKRQRNWFKYETRF